MEKGLWKEGMGWNRLKTHVRDDVHARLRLDVRDGVAPFPKDVPDLAKPSSNMGAIEGASLVYPSTRHNMKKRWS